MWKRLEDFKTMLAQRRKLCRTTAKEGDNIVGHLDKLKKYRDRINFAAVGDKRFEISDSFFNVIIAHATVVGHVYGRLRRSSGVCRREQWDGKFIPTHVIT